MDVPRWSRQHATQFVVFSVVGGFMLAAAYSSIAGKKRQALLGQR